MNMQMKYYSQVIRIVIRIADRDGKGKSKGQQKVILNYSMVASKCTEGENKEP